MLLGHVSELMADKSLADIQRAFLPFQDYSEMGAQGVEVVPRL